jgi:hypothetical protein
MITSCGKWEIAMDHEQLMAPCSGCTRRETFHDILHAVEPSFMTRAIIPTLSDRQAADSLTATL